MFLQERKKKERIKTNCDFATRRFRTLAVALPHAMGPTTFAIVQKRHVNLNKACTVLFLRRNKRLMRNTFNGAAILFSGKP